MDMVQKIIDKIHDGATVLNKTEKSQEDFDADENVRLPNINIAEQFMNIDDSGLCAMVAYIICGLRQLGGKVTFGEECVDRYEYQFATKLVEKLDASELNVLISHIAAGLNRIGGKVSFDK